MRCSDNEEGDDALGESDADNGQGDSEDEMDETVAPLVAQFRLFLVATAAKVTTSAQNSAGVELREAQEHAEASGKLLAAQANRMAVVEGEAEGLRAALAIMCVAMPCTIII